MSHKTKASLQNQLADEHGNPFCETKGAALVTLCHATGLRRRELLDLRGSDLVKEDGKYYIHVRNGKERNVAVIGDVKTVVALMTVAGDGKVFKTIPGTADIHSYRREYALAYYKTVARPLDTLSEIEKYYSHKAGAVYDRAAMLIVSRSLGHNRISVIAGHYLD